MKKTNIDAGLAILQKYELTLDELMDGFASKLEIVDVYSNTGETYKYVGVRTWEITKAEGLFLLALGWHQVQFGGSVYWGFHA